ncbi:hypothetical protein QUF72_09960 [Desulfobacterales bacterium HSG2]|nr:hypothetical protein [Desulfobacterales bacterium HSG2]
MMINYQGYLADTGGSPVSDTVKMTFRLYNTSAGGSALWTETHNSVTVSQGIFNVVLGGVNGLTEGLFDEPLYLGMSVGSDSEMTPRRELTSTAYSIRAGSAEKVAGLDTTASSQTSGASKIGVYDEFYHSSATNLQDILDDLDEAISTNKVWSKSGSDISYNNGNVGIGTANPSESLEVTGNIKATGTICDGNGCIGGSSGGGDVFTRWGNGECPEGTELLHSGFAFNGHYQQGGSAEPTCVTAGDVGAEGPGTNYGDLLRPLGTGDLQFMPPGIIERREVKCAKCYVGNPVFEIWGTSTCPRGWTKAYTGYGMGGYYNHARSNRKCVDNVDFDASVRNNTWGEIWEGSVLYENTDIGIYETDRFVKCAICIKE